MPSTLPTSDPIWAGLQTTLHAGAVVVTDSGAAPWGQALISRNHVLFADTRAESQGQDTGPDPHELVLMALGACTAITVRMYAARKGWAIERISVRLNYGQTPADGSRGPMRNDRQIDRVIDLEGPLDVEQRARLLAIAEKCPIHQLLTAGVAIRSELVERA